MPPAKKEAREKQRLGKEDGREEVEGGEGVVTWRPLAATNKEPPSGPLRAKAPAAYRLLATAPVCSSDAICAQKTKAT